MNLLAFLERLRDRWWAMQRAHDLAYLWPACKAQAHDIEHARAAFMLHAIQDPAWVRVYRGNLWAEVEKLT